MMSQPRGQRSCLFCKANISGESDNIIGHSNVRNDTHVGEEEEITIKKESIELIVPRDHEDFALEKQLKAVFILRRLLDLSVEKCAEYLKERNVLSPDSHPSDWFSLCGKCNEGVEECFQIYKEVLRWKRRLEVKKELLKNLIGNSFGGEWEEVSTNLASLFGAKPTESYFEVDNEPQTEPRRRSTRVRKTISHHSVPDEIDDDFRSQESDDDWQPLDTNPVDTEDSKEDEEEKIPFYCDQCHMIYTSPAFLRQHCSNLHRKKGQLVCTFCDLVFESSQLLNSHHQFQHSEEEVVAKLGGEVNATEDGNGSSCLYCQDQFSTRFERDYHIAKCHQKELLRCRDCGYRAAELRLLISHCKFSKHTMETMIVCEICSKPQNRNSYQFHMRAVHFQNAEEVSPENNLKMSDDKFGKEDSTDTDDIPTKPDIISNNSLKSEEDDMSMSTAPSTPEPEALTKKHQQKKKTPTTKRINHKCSECVASYETETQLKKHQQLHRLPPGVICNCKRCGWAFNRFPGSEHRKLCPVKSDTFNCPHCPAKFRWRKSYLHHISLHEKKGDGGEHLTTSCATCGVLVLRSKMYSHRRVHAIHGAKVFRCSKDYPRNGKSVKEEEIPYYCDHCHLIFPSQWKIVQHFIVAHAKDTSPLECDLCQGQGSRFESKQLLQMHLKTVHGKDTEDPEDNLQESSSSSFPCQHCSESFPSQMKLDYHVAKLHFKTQLICPICKTYKSREYHKLRIHMKRHDPSSTTMCEICSKVIKEDSLPTHMKLFHYRELGVEPIKCEQCDKNFNSKTSLKSHMNFVHLNNVPNCCPSCPKKFRNKIDLEKHVKRHEGKSTMEKKKKGPFICQFCEAKFNTKPGRYYHLKRYHNEKFLYRCEKCGKGYCFENTLMDHQKVCKKEN